MPIEREVPHGIPAQALASRIDEFLNARGYRPSASPDFREVDLTARLELSPSDAPDQAHVASGTRSADKRVGIEAVPAEFICEEDVRNALKSGKKLVIGEKTIVTPSARDLGESQKVFVMATWPN